MSNEGIDLVEKYVKNIFKDNNTTNFSYHDLVHTQSVVKYAIKIALEDNISNEEINLIRIAAWFHDTGYLFNPDNHEEKSCELAEIFLQKNHFTKSEIDKTKMIIMATKVPHNPSTNLEKIICDADLHHLGGTDFYQRNDLYRLELEKTIGVTFPENEWVSNTIDFLNSHRFFTQYAIKNFEPQKRRYIKELNRKLKELS